MVFPVSAAHDDHMCNLPHHIYDGQQKLQQCDQTNKPRDGYRSGMVDAAEEVCGIARLIIISDSE